MARFYEQIGIDNNLQNGFSYTSSTEKITGAGISTIEAAAGYFVKFFKWCERTLSTITKNWQLILLGSLACLILWKKL